MWHSSCLEIRHCEQKQDANRVLTGYLILIFLTTTSSSLNVGFYESTSFQPPLSVTTLTSPSSVNRASFLYATIAPPLPFEHQLDILESVRCDWRVVLRSIRSNRMERLPRSLYTHQLRAGPVDLVFADELHVRLLDAVLDRWLLLSLRGVVNATPWVCSRQLCLMTCLASPRYTSSKQLSDFDTLLSRQLGYSDAHD